MLVRVKRKIPVLGKKRTYVSHNSTPDPCLLVFRAPAVASVEKRRAELELLDEGVEDVGLVGLQIHPAIAEAEEPKDLVVGDPELPAEKLVTAERGSKVS